MGNGEHMIDLHTHTNISDGSFSPTELIQEAKKIGLRGIAITDHDCIEGHEEAMLVAKKEEVNLIQGIEFDTVYKGRRLHILGLGIDTTIGVFADIYGKYRKTKEEKLTHVFQELSLMGVDVSLKDCIPYQVGEFMDRQAIARCLIAKGYTNTIKESWNLYLDNIAFEEGELLDISLAFTAIHGSGGKAFLAHFHLPIGLSGMDEEEASSFLSELKNLGLDGMEYYYPSYSKEDQKKCGEYIHRYAFLTSGGTDFHGSNRGHIQLGIGEGDFFVPDELLTHIQ